MFNQIFLFTISLAVILGVATAQAITLRERSGYTQTTGTVDMILLNEQPPEVIAVATEPPRLRQALISYSVDNTTYQLRDTRPEPGDKYQFGSPVAVYYDPADPTYAVLAPADLGLGNRALLVTLAGAAFGVVIVDYGIRRRRG